jgi:hypothetical protein
MITGSASRSLPRAFLLPTLHRLVSGLLQPAEMLADLPPVGAGLEGLLWPAPSARPPTAT